MTRAEVSVAGESLGRIGLGFAVLLGVARDDAETDAEFIADRILGLRVFADAAGKMNLALNAVGGELLVISQFTLLADTSGGRRPSFIKAAPPELRARFTSIACRSYARAVLRLRRAGLARTWNWRWQRWAGDDHSGQPGALRWHGQAFTPSSRENLVSPRRQLV